MKILILGGTGIISSAIVRQGLAAGHEIVVVNRGKRPSPFASQIETICADRREENFASKLEKVKADAVIDMISYNAADARQTVQLFQGKTSHLIFTSSSAAYKRPFHSFPLREDAEELWDDPGFAYAYYKAEMERYLRQARKEQPIPITIIRPSLTFGAGATNFGLLRQNYNVVHRMRQHLPLVMVGEGTIPWSFTFSDDLAKGYILSCCNPKTFNDDFHVTNTEVVLWEDLYRAIGEIIGETPQLVYVPTQTLQMADPDLFGHLWYEKRFPGVFSMEKFQKAVPAYQPSIALKQGMSDLIDWWEKNACEIDSGKMRLEDTICQCVFDFQKTLCEKLSGQA